MELQLKVITLPCVSLQKRDSPMEWTESQNVALCKEVLVQNTFLPWKKTVQRAAIWQRIAVDLVFLTRAKFKVTLTKRSAQDRLLLITTKHKRRMATERREGRTSPQIQSLTNYWRTLWERRNVPNSDEKVKVKSLENEEVYSEKYILP